CSFSNTDEGWAAGYATGSSALRPVLLHLSHGVWTEYIPSMPHPDVPIWADGLCRFHHACYTGDDIHGSIIMGRPQRLMEARIITDRRQWNEFVRDTPTGHLCQTYEWSEHGEDPVAREGVLRVGVLDGDRLVGAVLLLRSTFGRIPGALYY